MQNNLVRYVNLTTHTKDCLVLRIKTDKNWKNWTRLTRQIYSLSDRVSDGRTETTIAQILNVEKETVHKILCLFYIKGDIVFLYNGVPIIQKELIEKTCTDILMDCDKFSYDVFKLLSFRSHVFQQIFETRKYTPQASEVAIFLNLLLRCSRQNETKMIDALKMIVDCYELKNIESHLLDTVSDVFLTVLKARLIFYWSQELEESWKNLLEIVFSALSILSTSPYLDF